MLSPEIDTKFYRLLTVFIRQRDSKKIVYLVVVAEVEVASYQDHLEKVVEVGCCLRMVGKAGEEEVVVALHHLHQTIQVVEAVVEVQKESHRMAVRRYLHIVS